MPKDRNPGVPTPMTIPVTLPLIGGQRKEKQIDIKDAVQSLMQQVGNLTAGLEQLVQANNTMAMDLELVKKRVDALDAKATLLPGKIEVTVKRGDQMFSPLLDLEKDQTTDRAVKEKRTIR